MKTIIAVFCMVSVCAVSVYGQNARGATALQLLEKKNQPPVKKSRELSVGLTMGVVPDMNALGEAILDDGVVDLNPESLASATGINMLIMSDRDKALLTYSSQGTSAVPLQTISDYEVGDPLIGLDVGAYVMFDATERFRLPVFARLGFDYVFKISGGKQKLTLGAGPDQVAAADGYASPPGGFAGGTASVVWNSGWMEIPLTVGVVMPVMNYGKIYGGLGISWFRGGFNINVKADSRYAAFLTSYRTADYPAAQSLMVAENINETITFLTYGFSFNMLFGFEVNVSDNVAVTVEYWASGTAQTVFAETEFSGTASRAITMATAGPTAAGYDNQYIERFAYPVVIDGSTVKFGARYYFL